MNDSAARNLSRGYTAAIASAAILSTTAILIRFLTTRYAVDAIVLAFWRDLFVVATLLPLLAVARPHLLRVARRDLFFLAGYGLVLALFNAAWTLSVAWNGASVATLLVYCSTAFAPLLGLWLLRERLAWSTVVAVAMTLSGCAMVAGAIEAIAGGTVFAGGLAGIAAGLLSGLGYACYSLMGRRAGGRRLDPWTTLLYTFGFAALFLFVIAIAFRSAGPSDFLRLGRSTTGWAVLAFLGAGPTVAGFGLYNVSLRHLDAGIANLVVALEPLFTAAMAFVLLGERLTAMQLAGGALILASVALLRARDFTAGRVPPALAAEASGS